MRKLIFKLLFGSRYLLIEEEEWSKVCAKVNLCIASTEVERKNRVNSYLLQSNLRVAHKQSLADKVFDDHGAWIGFPNHPCIPTKDAVFDGSKKES